MNENITTIIAYLFDEAGNVLDTYVQFLHVLSANYDRIDNLECLESSGLVP